MERQRLFVVVAILVLLPLATAEAEFHVAPDGSDDAPGTKERPFATLERARDAVRAARAKTPDAGKPGGAKAAWRIVLHGGTHRLARTVVFDLRDADVEVAAAPGEQPVLSGAAPLPGGWIKAPSDLPGLADKARGHVWQADVPADWSADRTRGGAADELAFRTLFQGETMLPRARTRGFRQLNKPPSGGQPIDCKHLYMPAEAVASTADFSQAEMVVVPVYPWVMNILPMSHVDRASGLVRTDVPATYPLNQPNFASFPDGTLWIENVLEALDSPGEWALDARAGKLYLWPRDGKAPGADVVAPRLTELVRVEGKIDYDGPADEPVRGVSFRGITFTQGDRRPWEEGKTGWGIQHDWEMFDRPTAMLRFRGAEDARVEDCRFVHAGGAGVRLDLHCRRIAISRCEVGPLGGAGVLLAGYGLGSKDVNRDNAVTDCHVHHVGRLLWHSAGIWAWQSGHNRIEHNHVHHTPYTGILVTGRTHMDRKGLGECSRTIRWAEVDAVLKRPPATWRAREPLMHGRMNAVAFNDMHHCMEIMGDGNAIYVSGTGGGNEVRNNFIHDIPAQNINASIRCDDDQHDTIIEDNVITRVCGEGFIWKGANTIRNNILYDIRPATPEGLPCTHQRGYFITPSTPVDGSVVQRNLVVSRSAGQALLFERLKTPARRPSLKTPAALRTCQADYNLYFNAAQPGWGRKHIDAQRAFGIEQHSIEADPKFRDAARDDFSLSDGSPALKLGFKPIDLSTVGPRKNRYAPSKTERN
ncbi:MAG: hypothetical protein BWX88_04997 [Planctomycetes bacterium ADurb.Bin126]|nr:MAG: hypothetical protein BWX88_04997 [Planctomycetes bacterium ADurb.Bin126]HOD84136.1 right-handed parallel beta-helix repeat-containing protein [Phycisphaerae bacterium]HQL76128.1 right-handed parallel beta-helix repeat-containing protein [Phycisphaerae bacterium]